MKGAATRHGVSFFDQIGEHGPVDVGSDASAGPDTDGGAPAASALPQKKPRKPDRRRALTRRAIIDAASELFEVRGVDATTIDDIAEAAELSAGTLYFHFGSKENLVLALVNSVLDAEAGYLSVADRSGPALERLLHAGDRYLEFAVEQPIAFTFILNGLPPLAGDASPDAVGARRAIASRIRAFAAAVAHDLELAMEGGEIVALPLDEALALVWSTWNGVAGLIGRGDEFAISPEFGKRVLDRGRAILLGGFLPGQPAA